MTVFFSGIFIRFPVYCCFCCRCCLCCTHLHSVPAVVAKFALELQRIPVRHKEREIERERKKESKTELVVISSSLSPSINIVCLKWILTLHVSLELVFCAKMKRFKRHLLGLWHAAYGVHSFSSTPLLADTCPTCPPPTQHLPVVFLFGFYNKRHNNYHLNYIGWSLFRKTFQLTGALVLPSSTLPFGPTRPPSCAVYSVKQ